MTSITVNGNTYNDGAYDPDSNPGGLGNGGHRLNLIPLLLDTLADSTRAMVATSMSEVEIGTGSKQFVLASEVPFGVGTDIKIADVLAPNTNFMVGTVTARAGTLLTVEVTSIEGSGTKSLWSIALAGTRGPQGEQGPPGENAAAFIYVGADAGGTADALTTTCTPTMESLADGNIVILEASAPNATTTPTFAPDGLGDKTIAKHGGQALKVGDIRGDGHVLVLRYDAGADCWELLNPTVPSTADDISAIGQGLHTIWLGAEAFTPTTTNGAAAYSNELATNDIMVVGKAFDQSTEERAQARFGLPKSYNGGTITAQAVWTAAAGTAAQTVDWGFSARVYSNDDAIDQAMGTEVTVSDALIATGDEHIAPVSGAITPAGTLSGTPKRCCLQVARKVGTDNLAADAILLGVFVYITLNAATDA